MVSPPSRVMMLTCRCYGLALKISQLCEHIALTAVPPPPKLTTKISGDDITFCYQS